MKQLRFVGYSDDTFAEEIGGTDHDNCADGTPIVFRLFAKSTGEGMFVWGLYSPKGAPKTTPGCWVIGLQQLDEDVPLPSWRMHWGSDGYSPKLYLEAPDDVSITHEPARGR